MNTSTLKKKVLLLAQTPPPYHGQAIMQQYLVNAKWTWCEKHHIRLDYSDNISEVGHFQFSKVSKLFTVLAKVLKFHYLNGIDVMYYPPAGPHRIPLYRDIITLLFSKLFARRVILHFHAGGLSELIGRLNWFEKFFATQAFKNIDCAIVLLPWLKHEMAWFAPKRIMIVPNGIEDVTGQYSFEQKRNSRFFPQILFVGNLKAEKGIFVLLAAAAKLKESGAEFCIRIMGESHSLNITDQITDFIKAKNLTDNIVLLGSLTGESKWKEFNEADIFCLPTYATEAMPVSILEAMMFSLPVISTNWRGIPDMITEGREGYLVPPQDESTLADRLSLLINQPDSRLKMGEMGRMKYEQFYTTAKHLNEIEKGFIATINTIN